MPPAMPSALLGWSFRVGSKHVVLTNEKNLGLCGKGTIRGVGAAEQRDELASSQGWHGLSPSRAAGFPHPQPSTKEQLGPLGNPEILLNRGDATGWPRELPPVTRSLRLRGGVLPASNSRACTLFS